MKKLIFSSFAVVLMLNLSAQRKCGATEHEQFLQQQNPKRAQERADYEKAIQKYIEDPLAEEIVKSGAAEGDTVEIGYEKGMEEASIKVVKPKDAAKDGTGKKTKKKEE